MPEKKKSIINFVDLSVIAVILFAVVAMIFSFYESREEREGRTKTISVTVSAELTKGFRTNLATGENLYFADSGKYLGKVVSIISAGDSEDESKEKLELTLETTALVESGSYYVSNTPIEYGKILNLRNKNIYLSGVVSFITENKVGGVTK